MKFIDADALIEQLSVNQVDCPGYPEPEFLPELIEVLRQAPSVQSVTDCISRKAAILQLSHNKCGNEEWDIAVQHDIETIKQLPSAQPESAKRTAEEEQNVSDSDLISRKAAIDALDEIRHALWEIDIPSPTVPEYIEHHEQIQSVWKLLDKKQKELYVLPSAQPERKKGKWIRQDNKGKPLYCWYQCSRCGAVIGGKTNFCSECGKDMREVDDESNQ